MPSILLCSSPFVSHLAPTAAVASGFLERGWRVRVLTSGRFADWLRDVGADPVALPAEADRASSTGDPSTGDPSTGDAPRGLRAMNDVIYETFYAPADAQFRAIRAAIDDDPVDVVGGDPSFTGMLLLNTLPVRPVIALASFLPLLISSPETAPFGTGLPPRSGRTGRIRNRGVDWFTRRVALRSVHRRIDGLLQSHGLPELGNAFMFDYWVRPGVVDLYGQFSPPSLEYPRSHLPSIVQFFGPIAPKMPTSPDLPTWWPEPDHDRPIVHVTQGTEANSDLDDLVRPTLEALRDEDVFVVVATGGRDPSQLAVDLPANARVAPWLPYDRLMPRISVLVTNGGYGGINAALTRGVPIVAAGDTQDKVETTARVGRSGAGINLRTGRPAPEAIRRAVRDVLADPSYRLSAERIAAEIASCPGTAGFVTATEDLLRLRAHG